MYVRDIEDLDKTVNQNTLKFKIPSAFYLFGHRYEVQWRDDLCDKEEAVGQSNYRELRVELQRNNAVVTRKPSQIENTFLHELVHCIFWELRENELRSNEKLVQQIAALLHQALTTAEYD